MTKILYFLSICLILLCCIDVIQISTTCIRALSPFFLLEMSQMEKGQVKAWSYRLCEHVLSAEKKYGNCKF